jgi:hypothetical protein
MNAKTKLACILIAILLIVLALLGSAYLGARIERNKYTAIVASIELEHERSMGELRSSLEQSQGRIDAIGIGLGHAVDTASKLADRSARIKALILGIDEAIRLIRSGQ